MTDKEKLQKAIGKRVREVREQKNIAQQTLAYSCGFDKSNMARLEAGNTNPTLHTLKKIADNLQVGLEELVQNLELD